jgi:hypothetical protein
VAALKETQAVERALYGRIAKVHPVGRMLVELAAFCPLRYDTEPHWLNRVGFESYPPEHQMERCEAVTQLAALCCFHR